MGRACWIWVALFLLVCPSVWAVEVHDVRLWRAPDHTRIVFDLSGATEHSLIVLSNPRRIVVDLREATLGADLTQLNLEKTPVTAIRSGIRDGDDLRVVLEVSAEVDPRSISGVTLEGLRRVSQPCHSVANICCSPVHVIAATGVVAVGRKVEIPIRAKNIRSGPVGPASVV